MRTFLLYFFLSLAIFSSAKSDILKVIDGDTIQELMLQKVILKVKNKFVF